MSLNEQKSLGKVMLETIRKNPGVFDALLEFERTKKLPKTVYKERLDITIDSNLLREFRHFCKENGLSMSRLIALCIREELGKFSKYEWLDIKKQKKT